MAISLQDAQAQMYAGGAQSQVNTDLSAVSPFISTVSGAPTAPQQVFNQTTGSGQGNLAKFTQFLGGLATQTGHMAEGAGKWLFNNVTAAVEAPFKLGTDIGNEIVTNSTLNQIHGQSDQLTARLNTLHSQFKAGQISSKAYGQGLNELNQEFTNLSKQTGAINNQMSVNKASVTQDAVNTASDLLLILTAGSSAGIRVGENGLELIPATQKTAAEWLASKVAQPILEPVAGAINKLATDSKVFQTLDVTTQKVLQKATAEVVTKAAPDLTTAQIARATAANVALKYPIYFNYMSSTGSQLYQELDQRKYGDAARTLAFNAALLLSGGPIGHALKYGGSALRGVTDRTFGQTAFWDELSKFYGDKTPDGFAKAISEKVQSITDPAARKELLRNLAAVEATNIHAVGGDAVAAAARLAKGEQAKALYNLSEINHSQALDEMIKFHQNYRLLNDAAQKAGLSNIALGRWATDTKNFVADALEKVTGDTNARLNAWEDLKSEHPNEAFANNANLDRQIKSALTTITDPTELRKYIMNIETAATVDGVPKAIVRKLAKEGYTPIKPSNLEAPFKEGGEKLLTAHANGEDFFVRATQPVPVLGAVGTLFTRMGLSPNASTYRVYDMFTENVARNLEQTEAAAKFSEVKRVADGKISRADYMLKQLSNKARESNLPIPDLRMLTTKQIADALKVSNREAVQIQRAITEAHLQVPLAVKGLGDRAVDWSYSLPGSAPIARRYLKLQGALRFNFNPFFRYLRLIPKTEILSEAEGGGLVRSLFTGRLNQISDIRQALHEQQFFDHVAHVQDNLTAEAVDATGAGANLRKHLVPAQEVSIAGLIDAQAQRMNMDWRDYIKQFPQETRDTIQAIAEYDKKANFINSPMARTLNIAIFPFRFEMKVANIMAKSLARTDLLTQVSFIHGLMKAHDFLSSPQGQAWYSQNSTAIGVFKYITPFVSMEEALSALVPGHDHSLGNFGEIGGLPFGWIPQLLDNEGITHFNQPGVDAKTGNPIPRYVPATTKAQAAIAIQDFLSMLFSYPGAEIGLPSKSSITRGFANGLIGANLHKDFTSQTAQLSPQQQAYANNVQNLQTAKTGVKVLPQPQPQSATVPTTGSGVAAPRYPNGTSSPTPKKKKQSQFTPGLLPGQTNLGQL